MDDTNPPATLQNGNAQDALNVEASLTGDALLKRKGFSRSATLTLTTAPVNGSFFFVDPNGNNQKIVCHDRYCAKSTNDAAFSVWLSSAGSPSSCVPTRWSFATINGFLYGANSCRDPIVQYDGTTVLYPATMPHGAVVEATKDRLVISDVSGFPSSAYYSQSGTYTNFTTGINSADPYVDTIGSPGDRVAGLKYALGKLYLFKTASITACILKDQYASQCYPVSNSIGTQDPLSIVEIPEGIVFRGQDRNYWRIDGGGLSVMSKPISNLVASQTSGSQQTNTQTSKSDWDAGTQSPSSSWNTTSVPGSVFPSSITFIDASGVSFSSGTMVQMSTQVSLGVLTLSSTSWRDDFSDGDYTSGQTTWTVTAGAFTIAAGGLRSSTNGTDVINTSVWISSGHWNYTWYYQESGGSPTSTCAISGGTVCLSFRFAKQANGDYYAVEVTPAGGSGNHAFNLVKNISGVRSTLGGTTGTNVNGNQTVTFSIDRSTGGLISVYASGVFVASTTDSSIYTPGYLEMSMQQDFQGGANKTFFQTVDDFYAYQYFSSGTFKSQIFDSGYASPIYGPLSSTFTVIPGQGWVNFFVHASTSPNNDLWTGFKAASDTLRISGIDGFRYFQYLIQDGTYMSSKTITVSAVALPSVTTGQFTTQCIQPGSNITSWGVLSCAETVAGNGSLVLAIATGTTCGTLATGSYTTQANNATITSGIGAAMNVRFTSLLTSTTDQAQADACTAYWNNGFPAPPVWGAFDSTKNAIYWTTDINNSATNNRVLKYDLNLGEWFPFDLQANAIIRIQNSLYFGDSTGGYWNLYGGVDNDNGSSISAYWKSKDFSGGVPFLDKVFNRISLVVRNQAAGSLTVTYTTSNNASGNYTVSLATTSGANYVRANQNLTKLSPYEFINVKFANASSIPFEIDGAGIDFTVNGWKPQNP